MSALHWAVPHSSIHPFVYPSTHPSTHSPLTSCTICPSIHPSFIHSSLLGHSLYQALKLQKWPSPHPDLALKEEMDSDVGPWRPVINYPWRRTNVLVGVAFSKAPRCGARRKAGWGWVGSAKAGWDRPVQEASTPHSWDWGSALGGNIEGTSPLYVSLDPRWRCSWARVPCPEWGAVPALSPGQQAV